MKKRIGGVLFLAVLFLGIVLLNRKDVQLQSQHSSQLRRLSASGYELVTVAEFNNPNLLSSTLTSVHEKFYINGKSVGILHMEPEQGIPGRKVTSFPVSLRIPASDLEAVLVDSRVQTVLLEIEGEIAFRNFTGGGKMNVQISDSVRIVN
ncbi:MAG: LEA type 2 family protein [Bacteroidetes bacterium]|nr:LEA type 2 family protein [Bacteroidota bacterium]